jgi:hypothetical protein
MGPLARALVKFLYQCEQRGAVAGSSSGGGEALDEASLVLL